MSHDRHVYVERALARIEADRASSPDPRRLICDLQSPDDNVRLQALRSACPCHVNWEVFDRVRKIAQRMRRDPNPQIRAAALHLEQDARMVAAFEAASQRREEQEDLRRQRGLPDLHRYEPRASDLRSRRRR